MKTQTYCYKNKRNTFITAKSLEDVPKSLQTQFGGLTLFKELDLNLSDPPRVAFDTKAAIADIEKQGYHISATETRFNFSNRNAF